MRVLVIDYKMNNLGSISRALEECGATVLISDSPNALALADKVVLPGVGSFAHAMANLQQLGFIDALHETIVAQKKPLLGICLGMQLLATVGFEGGENKGLGLIPGYVQKLNVTQNLRLPHMGWNDISIKRDHEIVRHIASESDFYFVHSYGFNPDDYDACVAMVNYGGLIPAIVQHKNIIGVQFHPEKSSTIGFQLLRNFLRM